MNMPETIVVNSLRSLGDDTLHVTVIVTKQFRFRMWLVTRLLALVALILGCNLSIDEENPEAEEEDEWVAYQDFLNERRG